MEAAFKLLFGALGFYQRILGPSQWARGETVDWTLIRPIRFHECVLVCGGEKAEGEHRPEFELQLSHFLGVRLRTNHCALGAQVLTDAALQPSLRGYGDSVRFRM